MQGENLKQNEATLLSVLSEGVTNIAQLSSKLHVNEADSLPDDIAFFTLKNI
jgi:hypothetical protein